MIKKYLVTFLLTLAAVNVVLSFWRIIGLEVVSIVMTGLMLRTALTETHYLKNPWFHAMFIGISLGLAHYIPLEFAKATLLISVIVVVIIDSFELFKPLHPIRMRKLTINDTISTISAWIVAGSLIHTTPGTGDELSWLLAVVIIRSMLYGMVVKGQAAAKVTAAGLESLLVILLLGFIPVIGPWLVIILTLTATLILLLTTVRSVIPLQLNQWLDKVSPLDNSEPQVNPFYED